MQRVMSIQNYKQVLPSQAVTFAVQEEHLRTSGRVIRLRVNAPEDVVLYATDLLEAVDPDTGELSSARYLVATVKAGFDEIEFVYTGDFALHASGEVWLDTFEGSTFVVEPADFETYARVFEREEEDPRVAEFRALQRQLVREREYQRIQDRIEFEARLAAIEAKGSTNVTPPANPASPPASSAPAGGTPVGASDGNASAEPAAGGNGGEPNGSG